MTKPPSVYNWWRYFYSLGNGDVSEWDKTAKQFTSENLPFFLAQVNENEAIPEEKNAVDYFQEALFTGYLKQHNRSNPEPKKRGLSVNTAKSRIRHRIFKRPDEFGKICRHYSG